MDFLPKNFENYTYSDNSVYCGAKLNGLRNGYGFQTQIDGGFYQGNFANGLAHGLGYLQTSSGHSYSGEFQKGKFHGLGLFVFNNQEKLEGDFVEGKLNGKGIYTSKDEKLCCSGEFNNNKLIKPEKCESLAEAVASVVNEVLILIKNNSAPEENLIESTI